jgi:hypothetical protein
MKKMKDVLPDDRPREKLAAKGPAALSDTELVEAIIGRGTVKRDVRMIARDISDKIRTSKNLPSYADLRDIEGVGETKAAQVMACFELGRRHYAEMNCARRIIKPEDVLPLVDEYQGAPAGALCLYLAKRRRRNPWQKGDHRGAPEPQPCPPEGRSLQIPLQAVLRQSSASTTTHQDHSNQAHRISP